MRASFLRSHGRRLAMAAAASLVPGALYFEKRTGQPAVLENKPGANGILGSQSVEATKIEPQ
jgi:hypothetical protein